MSEFQLPSICQFYLYSLDNYNQLTLQKIQNHLKLDKDTQQFSQKTQYYRISNYQLKRRSSYLQLIYALLCVYSQITSQISPNTIKQMSNVNIQINQYFGLKRLKLNSEQLTKIARVKSSIKQANNIQPFLKRMIFLLFQTEIYIFQIFIRLLIIQKIHSQNDKYKIELSKLKNKFYSNKQTQRGENLLNEEHMSKSSSMRCKQLFKQINNILTYYQLEISMNRHNCTIKPELQYLLLFIKEIFSRQLIADIFKNTQLGRLNLQLNQQKKDNIFVPVFSILSAPQKLKDQQKRQTNSQKMQHIANKDLQSQEPIFMNNEDSNRLSTVSDDMNLQKKQNQINHSTMGQMSEKSKSKIQRESAVSVYLKQKNCNLKNVISEYSQVKKLQYISINQRFSSRFNIQKKLVKCKDRGSLDYSQLISDQNHRQKHQNVDKRENEILKEKGVLFHDNQKD